MMLSAARSRSPMSARYLPSLERSPQAERVPNLATSSSRKWRIGEALCRSPESKCRSDRPFGGTEMRTPEQVLGPYFPVASKPAKGGDLVAAAGRAHPPEGELIEVVGHVINCDG